jgi:selenocysteine lyase/cysteine desulfurase
MGMPERYESGTLNTPGLAGLGAGVRFIAHTGIGVIAKREHVLVQQLLEGLDGIENVVCYGPKKGRQRAAAVSFCIVGHDPQTVAMILDDHFDIAVRAGLHCAPDAHDFIGTKQAGGTVRISPGYFNTEAEIDAALRAVAQIAKG